MYQSALRLFFAAGALALLAACSTTLPTQSASVPESSGDAAATTSADAPSAPIKDEAPLPADEPDSPSLLAGEFAKEFQQGKASWYGPRFHKRRTASGERYDMHALTAAHKTLPFGTMVRVRSLVNGKEVNVRITDRGPFSRGRVIDLSRAAAEVLDMLGLGVKDVLLLVPESTPQLPQEPRAKRRRRG